MLSLDLAPRGWYKVHLQQIPSYEHTMMTTIGREIGIGMAAAMMIACSA
ncbi:hypothetical protein [Nitrospira sp. KM1]|nr:hypothetical protein [Nitrospira sp. KM1]